jgi:hypothetical protein
MPLSYRIDAETGILHWKARGIMTEEELEHTVPEILSLMKERKSLDSLFDYSENNTPISSEGLQKVVSIVKAIDVGAPSWAIVVGDTLQYGIARQFQGYCELHGLDVQVFMDREEAEAWLLKSPDRRKQASGDPA